MERTFDRVARFDERSRAYPVRATITTRPKRQNKQWRVGPILDQGSEGACVGFGWTAEATATPVPVKLHDPTLFAQGLYDLAKQLDDFPGTNYDGTSVLAGAKAMVKQGLLKEYRWAFNIDDVVDSVLVKGPVVLGIDWRDGMYNPDPQGVIRPTGPIVGGHCIPIVGYRLHAVDGEDAFVLQNSWGPNWGNGGLAGIKVSDLATILQANGEACVPVHRSYGPGGL